MKESTTLSAQFEIHTRYRRSVHLERDALDPNILDGYVLTPLAQRTLARIVAALTGESVQAAFTITGPYGTGKSAFQVLLYALMCSTNAKAHKAARALVQRQAPELSRSLFGARGALGDAGLVPVILTGERGRLDDLVVRALERALREHYAGPGAKPEVLGRLHEWVQKQAKGKRPSTHEIVAAVEEATEKVCAGRSAAAGLFLVIDELGKFLEHAAFSPADGDLYLLQALAESACRPRKGRLVFLTSLHQGFDRYAARLGHVQRNEWAKVQGRFEDIAFQESPEQLLRLIGEAIHDAAPGSWSRSGYVTLARKAASVLAKPMNVSEESLGDALARCAPLHPSVAVLLGSVFRGHSAQNERSLFAFLASAEPHGFQAFLRNTTVANGEHPTYRLPALYDYVTTAFGMSLHASAQGKRWVEVDAALQRLDAAAPEVDALVLKTVGLLNALGTSSPVTASPEFVVHALEGAPHATRRDVEASLERLGAQNLLVFRRYKNAYQLWEGSDLDLEALTHAARSKVGTLSDLAGELQRLHPAQPIVAKRHLFQTGTFRYFEVRYLNAARVMDADGPLLQDEPEDADGLLLYILPADETEATQLRKLVGSPQFWLFRLSAHNLPVVVAVPDDIAQVREALQEVAALEVVRREAAGLDADAVARRELEGRKVEAELFLQRQVEAMFGLASKASAARCQVYVPGDGKEAPQGRKFSPRGLSNLLSDVCDKAYNRAPVILNELVNRDTLSSSAASARRLLIEAMVQSQAVPGLGFEGSPPERAMYRAVVEKYGLHRVVDGQLRVTEPSDLSRGIGPAWRRMEELLTEAEGRRVSVDHLFDVMAGPPYGLKRGVMPIMLTAMLMHLESEVALYEENIFVPQLSSAVLERLMRDPSKFQMQRALIEGARAQVLDRFATAYIQKRTPGRTDLVQIIRRLAVFMQDLPNHARLTRRVSKTAQAVRDALQMATEPAQLLFVTLPEACGMPPFRPDAPRADAVVDAFFKTLRGALGELQQAYDDLQEELVRRLAGTLLTPPGLKPLRAELAVRAQRVMGVAVDLKFKSFLARAADAELADTDWLVALATNLAGKPPEHWADPDLDAFSARLSVTAEQMRSLEALVFGAKQSPASAVRLAVLRPGAPERSAVIDGNPHDDAVVSAAEAGIEAQLRKAGLLQRKDLALRALAQLAQRLLSEEESPRGEVVQ